MVLQSLAEQANLTIAKEKGLDPETGKTVGHTSYLKSDPLGNIGDEQISNFIQDVKREKPLFLSAPEGMSLATMDDVFKDYILMDEKKYPVTEVFKGRNIRYVRNGSEDLLLGYREMMSETRQLRLMQKLYTGSVSEFKQNVVVKNPATQTYNFASNQFILAVNGVGFLEGAQNQLEFINNTRGLKDLVFKKDMINFKIKGENSKPKKLLLIKQRQMLEKKIRENPVYDAYKYGFMPSITDEMENEGMVTNDFFVEKVRSLIEGSPLADDNRVSHLFDKMARNIEKVNDKMLDFEFTQPYKRLVHEIAKKDHTLADMIMILYGSRNSPTGRAAGALMQVSDQMSRWALYKAHVDAALKKNPGMSDARLERVKIEGAQKALDSFIDYRRNLIREFKVLSDYAIYPFITFAYRIQKVLFNMLVQHPARSLVYSSIIGGGADTFSTSFLAEDRFANGADLDGLEIADTFIPGWF